MSDSIFEHVKEPWLRELADPKVYRCAECGRREGDRHNDCPLYAQVVKRP